MEPLRALTQLRGLPVDLIGEVGLGEELSGDNLRKNTHAGFHLLANIG